MPVDPFISILNETREETTRLGIDTVDPDPNQPRQIFDEEAIQELATSMRALGQLQPIIVKQAGARYRLVAGERRWRAAKMLGWTEIDARVLPEEVPELLAQVAENTMRENLQPRELLAAIDRMTQEGHSATRIAEALGVAARTVKRYRSLLTDPEAVTLLAQGASLRSVLAARNGGNKKGDDEPQEMGTPVGTIESLPNADASQVAATESSDIGRPPSTASVSTNIVEAPETAAHQVPEPAAEPGPSSEEESVAVVEIARITERMKALLSQMSEKRRRATVLRVTQELSRFMGELQG